MGLIHDVSGTAVQNGSTAQPEVVTDDDLYIVSVHLLCVECKQPIKATITTHQWIRVEWIGPSGECQACYQRVKEGG